MHKNFKDLTGRKFGRLTVLGLTDDYVQANGRHRHRYLCKCDCGTECKVIGEQLTAGRVKSCGCARRDTPKTRAGTHPYVGSRLYGIWVNMMTRCNNPNCPAYERYGGRGITACEAWKQFLNFHAWAVASGYADQLTLDRVDNEMGYSPENCRWADLITQANNKRDNRLITYHGRTMTIAEWARLVGMNYKVLHHRLSLGWEIERALTQPVRKSGRSNTNDG